jgi:hypothetical protein
MQDHSGRHPGIKAGRPSQAASTSEDRGVHGGEALHVPSTVRSGRDARDAGRLDQLVRPAPTGATTLRTARP